MYEILDNWLSVRDLAMTRHLQMYNWLSVRDFAMAMTRHLQMYNWLSVRDFGNDQASSDVQLA